VSKVRIHPKKVLSKLRQGLRFVVPIFVLIGIIAGIQIAIRFKMPTKAEAAWFDPGWGFRQRYPITNGSGSLQTDFQLQFTIDTATLITAGQMKSDCGDIRFVEQSGKLSSYWLEPSTCNTSTTKVWVKVSSIPTTGADIWFYYGNPSAASQSNTNTTFLREIPNVVGAWNMDESSWTNNCSTNTVLDASGNSNDGKSCPNGTGPTGGATGKFGNGGSFDGSDDYVAAGTGSTIYPTSQVTVSAWIKTTSLAQNGIFAGVWNNGGSSTNNAYLLYMGQDVANGKVGFAIEQSDNTVINLKPSSNSSITSGVWTHVAGVADGSKLRIYLNGVDTGTTTSYNGTLKPNPASNLIFGKLSSNVYYYTGQLDDVRVYNRGLTAAEIADIYSAGGNSQGYVTTNYPGKELLRKYNTSVTIGSAATAEVGVGPTLWYKFEEGTGTSAKDSSPNSNTGTLGGTTIPTWQTPDLCENGKCLYFDGATSKVTGSKVVKTVQSISFWIKPNSIASQGLFNFDGGTHKISTNGSGVLTATGFTSPTYYVNGVATTTPTLIINEWNHVEITTGTSFDTTSSFTVGTDGSNFVRGFIDDVKFFPYARSAAQAKADHLIGAAAIGSSSVIGTTNTNLSTGLAGYWKMDESSWTNNCSTASVLDSSGNGANGIACPNSTGPTGGAAGKFGNGGSFDGSDDYVQVSSGVPITPSFTASIWAKSGNATWNTYGWLASARGSNGFIIHPYQSSTTWSAVIYNSGGGFTEVIAPAVSNITSWHLYTISYDAAKSQIQMYVDGESVLTSTSSISRTSGTLPSMLIGADTGGRFGLGSLDEMRVYDRALSPAEVKQLYNFAPGPVASYTFEEGSGNTVNDQSGYANAGTWNGTGTHWVAGKEGKAGKFNGTNDYVSISDASNLKPNLLSLSTWFKTTQSGSASLILGKYQLGSPFSGYAIRLNGTANKIGMWVGGSAWTDSNRTVNDGLWHHFEGTYDGTTVRIYIDGVLDNSQNQTASLSYSGGLVLGANSGGGSGYYNGQLDDVKVYNYARSPQQIAEDMQSSGSLTGSTTGGAATSSATLNNSNSKPAAAVIHYKYEEGTGTTVKNSGSFGTTLDGTLQNMSSPATATSGWFARGKVNRGIGFDGTDDSINPASYTPPNIFSFTTWFNSSDPYSSANNRGILSTYSTGNFNGIYLGTGNGYNGCNALLVAYDGGNLTCITSTLSANTWYHLGVVSDGTKIYIYINGKLDKTITATTTHAAPLVVGRTRFNSDYWKGYLDETKVFPFALTPDQVRQEYNGGLAVNYSVMASESASLIDGPGAEPVAYWNFEERSGTSTTDKSGNNNTGTLTNGPTWTAGKIGSGLNLSPSNSYVSVADATALNITGDLTVEAWVKPNVIDSTSRVFLEKGDGASAANRQYALRLNSSNRWEFFLYTGSTTNSTPDNTTTPSTSRWDHVVGVRSGNTIYIYVNGVLRNSTTVSGSTNSSSSILAIGKAGAALGYFGGQVDEVKIFNYARTASQIAYDYNRGIPQARYKMDECQGTVINDSSSTGNSGTLTIGGSGTQTSAGSCNTSSTAWGNGATGKYNASVNLDGTDDYISIPNNSLQNITGDFTASAWFKTTSSSNSNPLIAKSAASNNATPYMLYVSSGAVSALLGTGSSATIIATSTTYNDGNWHQATLTVTGTTILLYVDGNLKANGTFSGTRQSNSNALYIGQTATGGSYFSGQIDDARLYTYALSGTQVKRLYNNDMSVFYGPSTGSP
jgi:hypothetical protein